MAERPMDLTAGRAHILALRTLRAKMVAVAGAALARVRRAIDAFIDPRTRDLLRELGLFPVDMAAAQFDLAQIGRLVAPSYLPLAIEVGQGFLAAHIRPGRSLFESPIVFIRDDEVASFCRSRRSFAAAASIPWSHCFANRDEYWGVIDEIASRLDGSPIPDDLREALDEDADEAREVWTFDCDELTDRAWQCLGDEHPFAGLSFLGDWDLSTDEAVELLQHVPDWRWTPELRSVYLGARRLLGEDSPEWIQPILSAEAWRESLLTPCDWSAFESGLGLGEWDRTLRYTSDATTLFRNTPFAPLSREPDTFTDLPGGAARVIEVGHRFAERGRDELALSCYRNAARLNLLCPEQLHPIDVFKPIIEASERIEPGGLATAIVVVTLAHLDGWESEI